MTIASAVREMVKEAGEKQLFAVWLITDGAQIEYEKLQNVYYNVPPVIYNKIYEKRNDSIRLEPPPYY